MSPDSSFSRSISRTAKLYVNPTDLLGETRNTIESFWDIGNLGYAPEFLEAQDVSKLELVDSSFNFIVINYNEEVFRYPTMGAKHIDIDHFLYVHCFAKQKARARSMLKEAERIFNNRKDVALLNLTTNSVWFDGYKKDNTVLGFFVYTAILKYESASRSLVD